MGYSSEALLDEACKGFSGHPVLDLVYNGKAAFDYFGIDIENGYTDLYDMIEESGAIQIAIVWCDGDASFNFCNMTPKIRELFSEVYLVMKNRGCDVDIEG